MKKGRVGGGGHLLTGVVMDKFSAGSIKKAAKSGAQAFEIRADTFKDLDTGALAGEIAELKKRSGRPVILTVRSAREGGEILIGDARRLEIFTALMPLIDFVDIELSSVKILKDVVRSAKKHKKKVIVSFHDFKRTPGVAVLCGIVAKARRAGADLVKIACRANSAPDVLKLTRVLSGPGPLIVVPMGPFGRAGRIFFPILGSMMSYCPITRTSAPGQMTIREFKDLTRRVV